MLFPSRQVQTATVATYIYKKAPNKQNLTNALSLTTMISHKHLHYILAFSLSVTYPSKTILFSDVHLYHLLQYITLQALAIHILKVFKVTKIRKKIVHGNLSKLEKKQY